VPSLISKPSPSTAQEILIKIVLKASKWPQLPFQESVALASLVITTTNLPIQGAERMLNTSKELNRSPYPTITITPFASREIHH
jgi:hypothetical protein